MERLVVKSGYSILFGLFALVMVLSCTERVEHVAPAIREQDSVPFMKTYGINMLISDSGVIKYRIVSERCLNNQTVTPKVSIFDKGVFMTQFDEHFHVQSYIQADTAYKYDEIGLFELRGRVRINTKDGVKFRGEELYWDQRKHEYYSNKYSYFETPERQLEGRYFRSDEGMHKYYVSNSKGSFEKADMIGNDNQQNPNDTTPKPQRQPATPRAKH